MKTIPGCKPNLPPYTLFIFFILSAAFLLRLYHLGLADLWYDEVSSISISESFWNIKNPPFYFAFLHYWIKLFGASEFILRFPSVIFSVLGVFFTFLIGKRIINARVGLFAATLMGISAFSLWYAQEARPYSLSLFLGTVSTYCFFIVLTEGKRRCWLYFILASALLIYSDITYFSFILLFAQLLSILIFSNGARKKIIYFLPVILIFLPFAGSFMSKLRYIEKGFWIPPPNLKSLIFTLENFNLGYSNHPFLYLLSCILSFILIIGSIFYLLDKKELREKTAPLFILTFLPILSVFIISKIYFSVYLDRGLFIFTPYYYILLALGAEYHFFNRWLRTAIISLLFGCFLIGAYGYYEGLMLVPFEHHVGVHLKRPFKPAIKFIRDNFASHDKIAHTNLSTLPPFNFYWGKNKIQQNFIFVSGMIDTNYKRPFKTEAGFFEVNGINLSSGERLWVISCDWPREGTLDENSIAVNEKLAKRYLRDLNVSFDGLRIYRYTNKEAIYLN